MIAFPVMEINHEISKFLKISLKNEGKKPGN